MPGARHVTVPISTLVLVGSLWAASCDNPTGAGSDGLIAGPLVGATSALLALSRIEGSDAIAALRVTGSTIPYSRGPAGADTLRTSLGAESLFVWDTASNVYVADTTEPSLGGSEIRFVLYDGEPFEGPEIPLVEVGSTAVKTANGSREVSVFVREGLHVELRAVGAFLDSTYHLASHEGVLGRLPRKISAEGFFFQENESLSFRYADSIVVPASSSGTRPSRVDDYRTLEARLPGQGAIRVRSEAHSAVQYFDADGIAAIRVALPDSTIVRMELLGHRAYLWSLQALTIDGVPVRWVDCESNDVSRCAQYLLGTEAIDLDGAIPGDLQEAASQVIALTTVPAYDNSSAFELLLAPAVLALGIEGPG